MGGIRFATTVTTLRHAPPHSLFNAMFSGRHIIAPDEVAPCGISCMHSWQRLLPGGMQTADVLFELVQSGCFFLDRDGRHFHDVLNFLRVSASVGLPATAIVRRMSSCCLAWQHCLQEQRSTISAVFGESAAVSSDRSKGRLACGT